MSIYKLTIVQILSENDVDDDNKIDQLYIFKSIIQIKIKRYKFTIINICKNIYIFIYVRLPVNDSLFCLIHLKKPK